MSLKDTLGLRIASREQQRRVAWIALGCILVIGFGAAGAFVGPYAWRHYTFVAVQARVTAIDTLCQYQIKRLSKRGPAQVTGLVDCATAEAEAARIDHVMGEIVRVAVVSVAFESVDGTPYKTSFDVREEAVADLQLGQTLAIQYDPEKPGRVQRLADHPFALTAAGRYDGAKAAAKRSAEAAKVRAGDTRTKFERAKDGEPMGGLEIFANTVAWIIIALMGVAILWAVRLVWRLARRLLGGGSGTPPGASPPAERLTRAAVPARAPRATFGQSGVSSRTSGGRQRPSFSSRG